MLEQVESSLWCAIFDSVVSIGLHLRDVAARLAAPASVLTAIRLLQAEREKFDRHHKQRLSTDYRK